VSKKDALAASFRETLQANRERDNIEEDATPGTSLEPDIAPVEMPIQPPRAQAPLRSEASIKVPPPSPAPVEPPASEPDKGKRGRPAKGKKSNEDYCTTTITIREDTRTMVKKKILDQKVYGDMSELVEVLLRKWIEGNI
jgi:hypothetical protein